MVGVNPKHLYVVQVSGRLYMLVVHRYSLFSWLRETAGISAYLYYYGRFHPEETWRSEHYKM